tara:strand:+ start:412 stop:969 length:558 start_codon:yes stop_codon:yes gene_type:complete
MIGLNSYIIKPVGSEYSFEKNGIILSSSIEDALYTNRLGVIVKAPYFNKNKLKEGDFVVVGHNTFRTYYGIKGNKIKSSKYFKENLYIVDDYDVLMYSKDKGKTIYGCGDYCGVEPIKSSYKYNNSKYENNKGKVTILNDKLKNNNININDIVMFKDGSEYEFNIGDNKFYMIRSKNIFAVDEKS